LLVRRERWTLTWTGRFLVLAFVAVLTIVLGRNLCAFLAVTSPVGGQYLVVEGWMPSYTYREAARQFASGGYRKVVAAGVLDWDNGGELRKHSGAEHLIGFGVSRDLVATTTTDEVQYDRTFHAALGVKRWLKEQGLSATSVDVVSLGAHARRTRLLYESALGKEVKVGVIAVEDRRYDRDHWWRSSVGVRTVIGESIAYLYARIFVASNLGSKL
jgi:hypothetical protein